MGDHPSFARRLDEPQRAGRSTHQPLKDASDRAEGFRATSPSRSGLTKTEAEELLDWLDATGAGRGEVSYQPGSGYAVRVR